jgi:hypothetical protein
MDDFDFLSELPVNFLGVFVAGKAKDSPCFISRQIHRVDNVSLLEFTLAVRAEVLLFTRDEFYKREFIVEHIRAVSAGLVGWIRRMSLLHLLVTLRTARNLGPV